MVRESSIFQTVWKMPLDTFSLRPSLQSQPALAAIQGLYQENQQLKRDLRAFDFLLSNFYFLISLSPPLGPPPTPLT